MGCFILFLQSSLAQVTLYCGYVSWYTFLLVHESRVEVQVGELLATLFKQESGGSTTEEEGAGATIVGSKSCVNVLFLVYWILDVLSLNHYKLSYLAGGVRGMFPFLNTS